MARTSSASDRTFDSSVWPKKQSSSRIAQTTGGAAHRSSITNQDANLDPVPESKALGWLLDLPRLVFGSAGKHWPKWRPSSDRRPFWLGIGVWLRGSSTGANKGAEQGAPGFPRELEELVVRFAQENRSWGYDRIQGALENLGYEISNQSIGNILRRHGVGPAPDRRKETTWKEFIRRNREVLAASDFFTAEVWTRAGLMTYYCAVTFETDSQLDAVARILVSPFEWPGLFVVGADVTHEFTGKILD